jgi:ribosome-binding protein aMBF1 (putative translation factor)
MNREADSTSASDILRRRYVGNDVDRAARVEHERVNVEVAQMIYDLHTRAGLTQRDLAKVIGTTQSVISRLEDADYEGHSLTMLQRIADAFNQRISVHMTPRVAPREKMAAETRPANAR